MVKSPKALSLRGYAVLVPVFAAFLALTIALQFAGGAWKSEFSSYPDEPAHFITGLMIRDYVASGFPGSPVKFAENYYLHYPKVAFGMWGPLLHILEAVWMLFVPPSHGGILVLTALITSATAFLLFNALLSEFGLLTAAAASTIFLCLPIVQGFTGMVMADGLVGLMDLCAAFAFARYIRTAKARDSLVFGMFTCLSILAKGNGVALVLLPAFALLFTRRLRLILTPSFWAGPAIIGLIAGPWQYYSSLMLSGIIVRKPGWSAIPFYAEVIFKVAGTPILILAVAGFVSQVVLPWKYHRADYKWACAGALIFAVLVFHCLIPSAGGEIRYLIAIAPPLLMFAAAGTRWALDYAERSLTVPNPGAVIAVVLLAGFFGTAFYIPHKRWFGFDQVAAELERPEYKNSIILVTTEADAEGMLIAEMAIREQRPGHIILRASKMLGQSDWNGKRYELLRNTTSQVLDFLHSVPVEVVVVDLTKGVAPIEHHELIRKTIQENPGAFQLIGRYPDSGGGKDRIEVYRVVGVSSKDHAPIRIDLPFTLGRPIESK